jgi:hypothetical protein
MKMKKFEKKLALSKETIADLSIGELGNVKGGGSYDTCMCATNFTQCGTCAVDKYTNCL